MLQGKYLSNQENKMNFMNLKISILSICLFVLSAVFANDFPYRADYEKKGVPWISTADLHKELALGNIIAIDTRSQIEYDAIHLDGAIHIPVSKINFVKLYSEIAGKNVGKKFAFYCNGKTCKKAYVGAEKAIQAGCKTCYAYDGGVPEWAIQYPKETMLLGKPIGSGKTKFITKDEFHSKCVDFETFKKGVASNPNAMVIDVRDHIQSTGKLPELDKVRVIPLDTFIPNFVMRKQNIDKHLYIFDQVGKQVRWLEYYLIENGYTNYTFLLKGATGVLGEQKYK